MGFRSTFVTEEYGSIQWPEWFRKKWGAFVWFNDNGSGVFASKREAKTYMTWADLPTDMQKAIDWDALQIDHIVLVYLHECGGITRCQISSDTIRWSEPKEWVETEGVEHDYCYGCSDPPYPA